MARAALRSSHVALIEHIEGSQIAMDLFKFEGKNNHSGNKLEKIDDVITLGKLPRRHQKFLESYFPEWLTEKESYLQACKAELETYRQISELAKQLSGQRELGKVQELVDIAKRHQNIIAFDSTVITLYYLKKLFQTYYPDQQIITASGSENEQASQKVLDIFKLEAVSNENCIALCSDKMSESVDLQKASCVFLLDTPSVLRVVEQRIGRVDRMDTMHDAIEIYWVVDSEEYALSTDDRLIDTNDMVRQIYGSNFELPDTLKERRFKNTSSTKALINEYKEFISKEESWTGIHDSFQYINSLKEGKDALINEKLCQQFTNVSSEVKTRVSFISTPSNWCFISLRGDKNKSPRWYFIDAQDQVYIDYIDVCQRLRDHISEEVSNVRWNDDALKKYIMLFKLKERELLPPKKKRALSVAETLIGKKIKSKSVSALDKEVYTFMYQILKGKYAETVDYERLAEEWVDILQPLLKDKRDQLKRKKILNLHALESDYKSIKFDVDKLVDIAERSIIADEIDSRIASCIIGVCVT